MKSNTSTEPPPGYDEMLSNIIGLAENLRGIQELGVAQYTPVVERIIRTRSRDTQHIQHTLDYLLDFACHPAGLVLFNPNSEVRGALGGARLGCTRRWGSQWLYQIDTAPDLPAACAANDGGECGASNFGVWV